MYVDIKSQILMFKGKARFTILYNPKKLMVNVCLMKIIKKHCHKNKYFVCFYNLGKENF